MSQRKINEWALPHVKKFRTYIDIGASIGDTAWPYVTLFQQVIAFEPNPNSYAKLLLHDNIISYNFALSNIETSVKLKIPQNTLDPEHGSIVERRNRDWSGQTFDVQTKTLDSFSFQDVDFIKIDVEQGELEVILGSVNTVKIHKPVIMFENKRNENDVVIDILLPFGYKIKKYKSDTIAYIED